MMKKTLTALFALALVVALAFSFAACKEDPTAPNIPDASDTNDTSKKPDTPKDPDTSTKPADTYTITFDSNGGSEIASITKTAGAEIAAPADPTKDGSWFLGWFESTDGGATLAATPFSFSYMPAKNVTLYAKWAVLSVENKIYAETDFIIVWGTDEEKNNVIEEMELTEEQIIDFYRKVDLRLMFSGGTASVTTKAEYSRAGLYYSIGEDRVITFYETAADKANNKAFTGDGFFESIFTLSEDYKTICVKMPIRENTYFEFTLAVDAKA